MNKVKCVDCKKQNDCEYVRLCKEYKKEHRLKLERECDRFEDNNSDES